MIISGEWRHMKAGLPDFGTRKHHLESYLGEHMWRAKHQGRDLFKVMIRDMAMLEYGE